MEALPQHLAPEFTFVQCALCRKWRRVPADHPAPEGWTCGGNPDLRSAHDQLCCEPAKTLL